MPQPTDLCKETLDLLILRHWAAWQPECMAWGIAQRIQQARRGVSGSDQALALTQRFTGWIQGVEFSRLEGFREQPKGKILRTDAATGKKQLEARSKAGIAWAARVALVLETGLGDTCSRVSRTPALLHLRQELR